MDKALSAFEELLNAVRKLRGPEGCSWDRRQTLESLRPYMLEEAYEVADAVDEGDIDGLKGELGDLLLHIVMSAEICCENGHFDLEEVLSGITGKLVRRHPHVFDGSKDLTPEEVEKQWEAIKAGEKEDSRKRFFDSIPGSMPGLQKAWRIQQRASEVGFPWPGPAELSAKLRDDTSSAPSGRLLFDIVNIMRQLGLEPEKELRQENEAFITKFHELQDYLESRGSSLSDPDGKILEEGLDLVFGDDFAYASQ